MTPDPSAPAIAMSPPVVAARVGFAIGAGGLGATALGWVADHWGLMASLWISALVPLAGCVITFFLPEPRGR